MAKWQQLFNRYPTDLTKVAKLLSAAKTPSELRALSDNPNFIKLANTIARRFAEAAVIG